MLDLRLHPETWRDAVRAHLSDEKLLAGLSVMTGQPIRHAIELGRLVKSIDPGIAVSWGGPHVTFAPDSVMDEPSCDYAISGYASRPLDQLVRALMEDRDPSTIPGVSSRRGGGVVRTPEIKESDTSPSDRFRTLGGRRERVRSARRRPHRVLDVQRARVPLPVHLLQLAGAVPRHPGRASRPRRSSTTSST